VGDHNVVVSYNGAASANFRSRVVARSYGMITLNSQGTGLAVIQNASDSNRVNQFTAPVRPGQVMVLWGTGLGPIRAADNAAPGAQDLRGDVNIRVLIGEVEVTPVYAGRSPSLPGADQINFTIPDNAPNGCTVPLRVRVGNDTSPVAAIAIAPGGRAICEHPVFSEDTLRKIDTGGNAVFGTFSLSGFSLGITVPVLGTLNIRSDIAGGSFQRITLANVDQISSQVAPTPGQCVVVRGNFDQSGNRLDAPVPVALDAGVVTLNGPNVSNRTFDKRENVYSLLISDPAAGLGGIVPGIGGGGSSAGFAPGTYTITGAGGNDVGPFTANLRVNAIPTWTNRDAINTVNRQQPLTVNWSGAAAEDLVVVTGFAGAQGTAMGRFDGASFTCLARGNANSLTVPASILQQLPAAQALNLTGAVNSVGLLSVSVASANVDNGRFTAPLRAGGNIDFGFATYVFGGAKSVAYQ
jgi:hypothetical protein